MTTLIYIQQMMHNYTTATVECIIWCLSKL